MEQIPNWCSRFVFVATMLLPAVAVAQSAVGSSCVTLDNVGGQQSFLLSQPVAANQWIVLSAVASETNVEFASTPVTDSSGNAYSTYDATLMANGSGVLVTFAARATTALNAGNQITVHYSDTGSSVAQSCVAVAAFPGVMTLADPSDGYGENYGSGNSLSVSTSLPTAYANDLVYSAFASANSPGSIGPLYPAQGLGQVCSTDASLCLLPTWNYATSASGINEGADASSNNAVGWGALIVTFRSNERLFADGFE